MYECSKSWLYTFKSPNRFDLLPSWNPEKKSHFSHIRHNGKVHNPKNTGGGGQGVLFLDQLVGQRWPTSPLLWNIVFLYDMKSDLILDHSRAFLWMWN